MIKVALKQKFPTHFLKIKIQSIFPGTFIVFNVFLYSHDFLSRDHRFKISKHFQTAILDIIYQSRTYDLVIALPDKRIKFSINLFMSSLDTGIKHALDIVLGMAKDFTI